MMLITRFLRSATLALIVASTLAFSAQAQTRDNVDSLQGDVTQLSKDFIGLQKDFMQLQKQVYDSSKGDLGTLRDIDVLKANVEKLQTAVDAIKTQPASASAPAPMAAAPAATAPSSSDSTEVSALKIQLAELATSVAKLQAAGTVAAPASTPAAAPAEAPPEGALAEVKALNDSQSIAINMMWTLITGFIVMFMQAGFALVETGFTRAKSAGHTMSMNFMIYSLAMFGYWVTGFAIQFGGTGSPDSVSTVATLGPKVAEVLNSEIGIHLGDSFFGFMGASGYMLTGDAWEGGIFTLFLFQMVFMGTTATVPTGAMAERWKFKTFVVYGFILGAFIYPLYGNWVWGGGWLAALGKNFGLGNGHVDFAGSSVVHLQGGVLALVGAWIIGPRYGKFNKDGSPNPIPGHNVPMAMLGTFILAFGWFGFNPGSTLAGMDSQIGIIAVNTMLAGTTGCITGMFFMWYRTGKPDMSFMCNGLLAGLVAITAPCAFVEAWAAALIGVVAGFLVVFAAVFVEEKLKLDDPVGAVAVHGVNGAWGCLALGLLANGKYGAGWNGVGTAVTGLFYGNPSQFGAQIVGVTVCIIADGIIGYVVFKAIDAAMGLRSEVADEIAGLDIPELGGEAYPKDYNPVSK